MSGDSALKKALNGEKVSDKQAKGALNQAVAKIASLTKRAGKSKEAMAETGSLVIYTAETQGSLFLASLAEGYLGPEKIKLGSVDLRGPIGLAAQGYGLYEAMSGRAATAGHALALGNGIMGSWLASVAVNAGHLLANKSAARPTTTPEVRLTPADAVQGLLPAPDPLEGQLNGPLREVLLTPQAPIEGEFEGRRRRHQREERFEDRPRPRRRERMHEDLDDDERPRHGRRRARMKKRRARRRFRHAQRQEGTTDVEPDGTPYLDEDDE